MSTTTIPALTAPPTIAQLRQLLAALRTAGYEHLLYPIGEGPIEHTWRTADKAHEVSYCEGQLTYTRDLVRVLQAEVDSVERAAALLRVYDVIPEPLPYERDQDEDCLPVPAGVDGWAPTARADR